MQRKILQSILIIFLVIEILAYGILINNKITGNNNIFQYMKNNINQLFLQEDPITINFPNKLNNYIQMHNYVTDYIDENNANTNIYFTIKQKFSKKSDEDYFDIYKTFEIKQTTKYNNQAISVIINSTNIETTLPNNINDYYVTNKDDYKFVIKIDFSNNNLSLADKEQLYSLWFSNFKILILEKIYENSAVFSPSFWGEFSDQFDSYKDFMLNEAGFNLLKPIIFNDKNDNTLYPLILYLRPARRSIANVYKKNNPSFASVGNLQNYLIVLS